MAVTPIYIAADHAVTYESAYAGGSYLNSGTCTFVLKDADGATVASTSGAASYVAASNGNYAGVIESTALGSLTVGALYYLEITFAQSSYNDFRRIPLKAQYREKT